MATVAIVYRLYYKFYFILGEGNVRRGVIMIEGV